MLTNVVVVVCLCRLTEIEEETYLCPSEVGYVRPLRAVNTDGKWRVIVNNIKVNNNNNRQLQVYRRELLG